LQAERASIQNRAGQDKRWSLFRVTGPEGKGAILGTYQGRRDANNALEKIAYAPEPQW
jgi:hypothetical protein